MTGSRLTDEATLSKRSVFERKVLDDLQKEFEGHAPVHAPKGSHHGAGMRPLPS